MRRIKMVLAVAAVAAMLIAGQAAPAMADVDFHHGDIDFDHGNGGFLIVGNNDFFGNDFLDDDFFDGDFFDNGVIFFNDGSGISQSIENESESGDVDLSFGVS